MGTGKGGTCRTFVFHSNEELEEDTGGKGLVACYFIIYQDIEEMMMIYVNWQAVKQRFASKMGKKFNYLNYDKGEIPEVNYGR